MVCADQMDQDSRSVESIEREVTSEPASTRRNPFVDNDISSRKRRRTSLGGASGPSRSRSVESADFPLGQGTSDLAANHDEASDELDMKVDSSSERPRSPQPQTEPSRATSANRPSRVTINVRTPSCRLEASASSPHSPRDSGIATCSSNDIKTSVEEPEAAMTIEDVNADSPVSLRSDASSPPIELVSHEDEDAGQAEVEMMHEFPYLQDPALDLPFHDLTEPPAETIIRLSPYFSTHEQVAKNLTEWAENYFKFARGLNLQHRIQSYRDHRDLWHAVPELVLGFVSKRVPYPREDQLREDMFSFYRVFAKLAAYWLMLDVDTTGPVCLDLASTPYIHALAALTRPDEVAVREKEPKYEAEVDEILNSFKTVFPIHRPALTHLRILIDLQAELPRLPKCADSLGWFALLSSNIVRDLDRQMERASLESPARSAASQGWLICGEVRDALETLIEKHINHLSFDAAHNYIPALEELYKLSIVAGVVPAEAVRDHLRTRVPIANQHVPDAMAYLWKFEVYSRLIRSSQMQLRMFAVTSMCNDLVNIWRRFNDADDPGRAFVQHIAEFLLKTNLLAYILGPTCHPEITSESSNIIGFLLVSKTYTNEHTDALWRTYTTTQDPRISDALIKMIFKISNLLDPESLLYFCEKLRTIPIKSFNSTLRDLCDSLLNVLRDKALERHQGLDGPPYALLVRLIREASVLGPQMTPAYPDVQVFANTKFRELLLSGPGQEGRLQIYADCMRDIAAKSPTALGSLWVVFLLVRNSPHREIRSLTAHHDLTRLAVDELEAATTAAKSSGLPAVPVFSGPGNVPRKELIQFILLNDPSTISKVIGPRLWNLLVGSGASCQEDRDAAWQILNATLKKATPHERDNPYISTCLAEYFPTLEPRFFCAGALEFARGGINPQVENGASIMLDDDDPLALHGLEQLWHMILTAPTGTIEREAIRFLVNDIYLESQSIKAFPHYRARKVHLRLVDRCLRQLSLAATKLKFFSDGTSSGEDEPMVIVATEEQLHQQELLFIRSLCVLREFHQLHRTKSHFSAPNLRTLMLDPPQNMDGESAELKYQSFDGPEQGDIRPINVGQRDTAASLLAIIRAATGFSNYRMYYRGRLVVIQESDLRKNMQALHMQGGLILVKREHEAEPDAAASSRIRPGATPVEVQILSHFDELWEYLTMDEKLSQEIYSFLIKLPADERMLRAIKTNTVSYKDLFPLGQSFKSLYAVYALQEYLDSQRRKEDNAPSREEDVVELTCPSLLETSLHRAMSLVVAAIADSDVIAHCPGKELQAKLSLSLVECFVRLIQDPKLPPESSCLLDTHLLDRLLTSLDSTTGAAELVCLILTGMFQSCSRSLQFWFAFRNHAEVPRLLSAFLLHDPRPQVRQKTAGLIKTKMDESMSDDAAAGYRAFFWPLVSGLVGDALGRPETCVEVLDLCWVLFSALRELRSCVLDLQTLLRNWIDLLLVYTTFETVTHSDVVDNAAFRLVRLVHTAMCVQDYPVDRKMMPPGSCASSIFWKHLFPPYNKDGTTTTMHRPMLYPQTRAMLLEILLVLVGEDGQDLERLLHALDELVPVYPGDDGDTMYAYELQQQFDRFKAIRAPCGYVGLKNLSNTCYLNSLFTQLFMNVNFRDFMLATRLRDPANQQELLFKTQTLFGTMQESIRRFVSPEDVVDRIKTYEDGQIDVHSQMDVDEFYNLLFDRWEGQFLDAEAKKRFRSFYGGQLVQQVKSKECEHISERLEPFSAIQCDIKGKSSLEESLQAYVDGEIMQGDNKYKCSTCDSHVDAVKRACLKDIPNNLIFHLKRFDFNLRTFQRSKIYDYFTFPDRIDMRPYTMDHITSPDKGTDDDVFELVGVLVHSGTAESGHYYSYIRERPSSSEQPAWFEFNDDAVSPWDPTQMETACFGGPDYRTSFDANNGVYDKLYSAYMLFYQRSSALSREQALLRRSGKASPVKVRVSPDLHVHIERENTSLLRRHCLFDPAQIQFVQVVMTRACHVSKMCEPKHAMEDLTMSAALSHLDQVAARTKDVPEFRGLARDIRIMCTGCPRCALCLYEYFETRPAVLRWLLMRNPDADVRQETGELVLHALHVIKKRLPELWCSFPDEPDDKSSDRDSEASRTVVQGVVGMCEYLFEYFHHSVRAWCEVFGFMIGFVKMGRLETISFLPLLRFLLWTIIADHNVTDQDLPPQFQKLASNVSRRMATRALSYEEVIGLLSILMSAKDYPPSDILDRRRRPTAFSKQEQVILSQEWTRSGANVFMARLIAIDQNREATYRTLRTMISGSQVFEDRLFRTLKLYINGGIPSNLSTPYLRVASAVFYPLASQRRNIQSLVQHISMQGNNISSPEGQAFLDFHRGIFMATPRNCLMTSDEARAENTSNIAEWAPGLLGYHNQDVVGEVETFLHDHLFSYGVPPVVQDCEFAEKKAWRIAETARKLGLKCLLYLKDNFVSQEVDISSRVVAVFDGVIDQCAKYFTLQDTAQTDAHDEEFAIIRQDVMESLRRLVVEEIEEDGSNVFSDDSSSVTSSVTAG